MKRNFLTSVCAVFLLWATGMTVRAANSTILVFSVNMATNLANGSFNPPPPVGTGTDVVTVNGSFNGFAELPLVQEGSSTIWTNTANDTGDANGDVVSYKFTINGNYETTASYDNRAAYLPSTYGAIVNLPTPYYGDVGPGQVNNVTFQVDMSEQIELGNFTPGTSQVDVRGDFNGWGNSGDYLTNDPNIVVTNEPSGVVESNVYVGTFPMTTGAEISGTPATNAFMEWKAVEDPSGSWETPGPTTANDADNRFFYDNTNQTLPLVSFSDLSYTPSANVTLNCDMSGVLLYDTNYVPNSVTVWGTFNGWANGVQMTNDPAPNTNIFSVVLSMPETVANIIQVRYTNSAVAANNPSAPWVYDYLNDNVYNNNDRRTVTLPLTSTTLTTNMPVFHFLDLALNDYLPKNTAVFFSVDMSNAVDTNGYVFTPANGDNLYINASFANYGGYPQVWYPWSAAAPQGFQMIEEGSTLIYTNTIIIPAGAPVLLTYQYGIDPDGFYGGPIEDEALPGNNHVRVLRTTGDNPYVAPMDAFTNAPYQELFFSPGNIMGIGNLADGDLTVGAPAAGMVPVSWLGRPGAHLQSASSLNGPWTDNLNTDGTNWTSGVNTINGLKSVTNWPTSGGTTYFRLVKP
jgi:hypothetical protein